MPKLYLKNDNNFENNEKVTISNEILCDIYIYRHVTIIPKLFSFFHKAIKLNC